jgi:two-component system phosphate regulon sensor histidine kinase PhoR
MAGPFGLLMRAFGTPARRSPAGASVAASPEPSAPALPFEAMLAGSPNPILLIAGAPGGGLGGARVLYANPAAAGLFRFPGEGALLASVIRQPEALEVVDQCLATHEPATSAFDFGGPPLRSWRAWARPLDSSPERRLVMLLLTDETDARRTERMRADFLANASHELRTPLASLVGFIETLQGPARDDPAAQQRFLGIMAGQAGRMARLVEDLLSLSRIEMSEHVPPTELCDLGSVAADVVAALGPVSQERQVRIALGLPPAGSLPIVGDRDQLVQVALNLIDNAVKYSAAGGQVDVSGGVAASFGAALAPPEGGRLADGGRMSLIPPDGAYTGPCAMLRIEDRGPGIAREHLARLSERFYRVEGQKSGERAGTGLGLAIVKHIVNRHRGALVVESAPGRGTAFTVAFPLAAAG